MSFNNLQLGTFLIDPTNPSDCIVYVRKNAPNQAPVVFFDGGTTYYGRLEFHDQNGVIKGVIKSDSSAALWLDMRSSTLGVVMSASGGVPIFIFGPDGVIRNASNAALLSNTTLGSGVVNSSLTSLGTLTALNCTGTVSIGTSGGGIFYNASTVRVGVRNNNPQYTFDCNGFINSTSYLVSSQVVLTNTTLGTGVVNSSLTSVGTLTSLTVNGNVTVKPAANLLKIDATSELVGIGVGTPAHKLDVVGNINTSDVYKIGGTDVLTGTTLGSSVVNSSLTSVGTLTDLTVSGNISATNVAGTLTTASQPNVTSVGTLTNVNTSGAYQINGSNFLGSYNSFSTAVGGNAGQNSQGSSSVAVGFNSGRNTQGQYAVAVGIGAGDTSQGENSIAVGKYAGFSTQGSNSVAVGNGAASFTQGSSAVAIGVNAGRGTTTAGTGQGNNAVAIGNAAGATTQGDNSVAIGLNAGLTTQGIASVAIGDGSGNNNQGSGAVAIGRYSGNSNQGAAAVAIGRSAGETSQHANSIILNATNTALNSDGTSRFYVKPVRNNTTATSLLQYDATSGEITYGPSTIAGTLTTAAQPNVTSVGTLTNVNTSGIYRINGYDFVASRNTNSVSVGINAGITSQNPNAVAIGNGAGRYTQGYGAVAVGPNAGVGTTTAGTGQGNDAVAIGGNAGENTQGASSTAIGPNAGRYFQGSNAVSVGNSAGNSTQGTSAVAIGPLAGQTNQHANSIILNGSGAALNSDGTSRFYVKPVRNNTTATSLLQYDATSGEITYGPTNIAGTLTTAAQPNITSIGTLSSLTVSNSVSAGTLSLQSIANTSTSNVLYYDTTTKTVTYAQKAPTLTSFWLSSNTQVAAGESNTVKNLGSITLQAGTYLIHIYGALVGSSASSAGIGLSDGTVGLNDDPKNGYPSAYSYNLAYTYPLQASVTTTLTNTTTLYLNAVVVSTYLNTEYTAWVGNKCGITAAKLG